MVKKKEEGESPSPSERTEAVNVKRAAFEKIREKSNDELLDSINTLEGEFDDSGIIQDIKKYTMTAKAAMDSDPMQLQVLANMQVELSMLIQRMSERQAMAGYNERAAEYQLKKSQESLKIIFVEGGDAIGVADSKKVLETESEFYNHNHAKYLLDNINLTRRATDKTIDTIRSKLSYEKTVEERG